jgi:hypothetical protein
MNQQLTSNSFWVSLDLKSVSSKRNDSWCPFLRDGHRTVMIQGISITWEALNTWKFGHIWIQKHAIISRNTTFISMYRTVSHVNFYQIYSDTAKVKDETTTFCTGRNQQVIQDSSFINTVIRYSIFNISRGFTNLSSRRSADILKTLCNAQRVIGYIIHNSKCCMGPDLGMRHEQNSGSSLVLSNSIWQVTGAIWGGIKIQ